MSWQPLLAGEEAARAREAIDAIAVELAGAADQPGLDRGDAGRALLAAYLARSGAAGAAERAADALERALGAIGEAPSPWLLDGFSGIAWAAAHLADLVELDGETWDALDGLVGQLLAAERWPFDWEYVAGLVGLGVYALERRSPAGAAMRARVVTHLAALAERGERGVTWRAPARLLPAEERARHPRGLPNLGLAHGVAGVIAFLAGAGETPGARELLGEAVDGLLAHDTGDPAGRFPGMVGRGRERPGLRRDGWCYGDQAIAAALLRAARALERPELVRLALDLAGDVAGREAALETSFCHGTLGRAHMFNRLAQATGDAGLADAARRWYRETLARRRPGRGLAGFECERGAADLPSLLVGAGGIALGLLAAVAPVEPAWDRAFLIDLPPAAAATWPAT